MKHQFPQKLASELQGSQDKDRKIFLLDIRSVLVDRLFFAMFLIALIATPISLYRASYTGWNDLYTSHLVFSSIAICLFLFRNAIPYFLKSFFIVTIFSLVGIFGLFTLGLLSIGILWLITASALIYFLYSSRAGLVFFVIFSLIIGFAAYCFYSGRIVFQFDANEYIKEPSSWISMYIGALVVPYVFFQTIMSFQYKIMGYEPRPIFKRKPKVKFEDNKDNSEMLAAISLDSVLKLSKEMEKQAITLCVHINSYEKIEQLYDKELVSVITKTTLKRLNFLASEYSAVFQESERCFFLTISTIAGIGSIEEFVIRTSYLLNQTVKYQGKSYELDVSVGASVFPKQAQDAGSLQALARNAAKKAKEMNKKYLFATTPPQIVS